MQKLVNLRSSFKLILLTKFVLKKKKLRLVNNIKNYKLLRSNLIKIKKE